MKLNQWFRAVLLAGFALPAVATTPPVPSVDENLAVLSFSVSVDPAEPTVGEDVTLSFDVSLVSGFGGLPVYNLVAADLELLSERTVSRNNFNGVVEYVVRAGASGSYDVALAVSYETGIKNEAGGCCIWFFRNESSPTYQVAFAEGAVGTMTATATETATPTSTPAVEDTICPGDCNGDFRVEIAELVRGVGIALGDIEEAECSVFGDASVSELVTAVRSALEGCAATARPAEPTDCLDCCSHCIDPECVAQCAGIDRCDLVAEWYGVVRDADTAAPIAGAVITLNGVTTVSAADGSYRARAERPEICTGLDYLYEFSVTAPGYTSLVEQLYRVPFPTESERSVELAPVSQVGTSALGVLHGGPPMVVGRIF